MWSLEYNKSFRHEGSQPENEASTQRRGKKQEGSREGAQSHCLADPEAVQPLDFQLHEQVRLGFSVAGSPAHPN